IVPAAPHRHSHPEIVPFTTVISPPDSRILRDNLLRLRRVSEDDIELYRQFAYARTWNRSEGDDHGSAGFGVLDLIQNHVGLVLRVSLDVTLRRELFVSVHLDGEVDVRCARGIGDGLDGAKIVFAGGTGEEATKTLEVGVPLILVLMISAFGMD